MNTAATQHFRLVDDLDIAAMTFAAIEGIQGLGAVTSRNIRACVNRSKERRALARLDDRMIADVGLDRAVIDREVRKYFWQK